MRSRARSSSKSCGPPRRATLYANPAVWHRFGYEGASSHLGGYIERGFDDLDWISEDEVEAETER